MGLQNRVTPEGEIVRAAWRGAFTGNRGCLHGPDRELGAARWRTKAWICCLLEFRGRRREPMPPGKWTALFFWDEAMALAAGHRPCGECRHADHVRFREAWAAAGLPGRYAREIDAELHEARVTRRREKVVHVADAAGLPDGTVLSGGILLAGGGAFRWSPEGYAPVPRPGGAVTVLTPAPVVTVLRAGYRPAMRLDQSGSR